MARSRSPTDPHLHRRCATFARADTDEFYNTDWASPVPGLVQGLSEGIHFAKKSGLDVAAGVGKHRR